MWALFLQYSYKYKNKYMYIFFYEFRRFLLLLFFVFLHHTFTIPANAIYYWSIHSFTRVQCRSNGPKDIDANGFLVAFQIVQNMLRQTEDNVDRSQTRLYTKYTIQYYTYVFFSFSLAEFRIFNNKSHSWSVGSREKILMTFDVSSILSLITSPIPIFLQLQRYV